MSRGCERNFLILIALLSLCFYFLSIFSFGTFSGKARSTRFTWAKRAAWTRGECLQTKTRLDLKNNIEFWRLMHAEMVPATWSPPVLLNLEADGYIHWSETRRRGVSSKLWSCDLCSSCCWHLLTLNPALAFLLRSVPPHPSRTGVSALFPAHPLSQACSDLPCAFCLL